MVHPRRHDKLLKRLAKIEGHIRSITRMVDEGRDCPDVLVQVAAVRSALDQAGRLIMEDHVETCIATAIKEGRGESAVEELKDALVKFIR